MMAECSCPHCQTVYPLVDRLIGSPVRCRQCRKPFIVDENGVARPLITNKPKGASSATAADDEDDAPLDIRAEAVERPQRPSTKRLQRPDLKPQRKRTSVILSSMSPNGLGSLQAAVRSPAANPQDALEITASPPSQPPRRVSTEKRFKTELIMSAMRRGALNQGGMNRQIAEAISKRDDLGNESTSYIKAGDHSDSTQSDRQDDREVVSGPRVQCPHCQTEYPFRESLCDRLIRCSSCAGVFKVFPDASSEPAIVNRSLPDLPSVLSEQKPTPKPQRSKSQVIRNRDLVKAMSGNMAKVAEAVLPNIKSRNDALHERVVVQEGLQERKSLRRWYFLTVALCLGVVFIAVVMMRSSPNQATLRAFESEGLGQAGHQQRSAQMRHAAWSSGATVQPIIGLRSARFQSSISLKVPSLDSIQQALRGRVKLQHWDLWVDSNQVERARMLVREWELNRHIPRDLFQEELAQRIEGLSLLHIERLIDNLPTSNRGKLVFQEIFADPDAPLALRFLTKPPSQVEVVPFSGREGRLILPTGTLMDVHFKGHILRLDGVAKVLSLRATKILDPNQP